MDLPKISPLMSLPHDILLNHVSTSLGTSDLSALSRTCTTINASTGPVLTFVRMKASKERGVLPEFSPQTTCHLRTLANECRLRKQIRENPPWKQSDDICDVLFFEISDLPVTAMLHICTDHFEALMGDWSDKAVVQMGKMLERAAQSSGNGECLWQAVIDGYAALLRVIYLAMNRRDAEGKFTKGDQELTRSMAPVFKTFLRNVSIFSKNVDKESLGILLGELLRTYTRGYLKVWKSDNAKNEFKNFFIEQKLVTGQSEWNELLMLATSKNFAECSYLELNLQSRSSTSGASSATGKPAFSEPVLSVRSSSIKSGSKSARRAESKPDSEKTRLRHVQDERTTQHELAPARTKEKKKIMREERSHEKPKKSGEKAGSKNVALHQAPVSSTTNDHGSRRTVEHTPRKKRVTRKDTDSDSDS